MRPASQAVSKQHCAVIVRDGKVFVRDFGSTNGTLVNDALVQNEERAVINNDALKIGPLDFTIRTVPARFASLGDLHATIDDRHFTLDRLLEWADRDEKAGLEGPADTE